MLKGSLRLSDGPSGTKGCFYLHTQWR